MSTYPKAGDLQRATASHLTANPIKVDSDNLVAWDNDDYQWFIVGPTGQIASGWEYKSDAIEMGDMPRHGYKVVHRRTLKAQGVDPSDPSNWGDDPKTALNPSPGRLRIVRSLAGFKLSGDKARYDELVTALRREMSPVAVTRMEVEATQEYMRLSGREKAPAPFPRGNPESTFDSDILEGMARALWVTSYADWVEQQDVTAQRELGARGGQDWNDVAPETPESASDAARDLYLAISRANDKSPVDLLGEALRADGKKFSSSLADSFGHYLAMQALGHGVSWFDDHAQFRLKVPGFEAYCPDGMDLDWSPKKLSTQNPAKTRGGNAVSINYEPVDLGDEVVWSVNSVDAVADDAIGQFSQHDTEKAAKAHAYAAAEELRSAGYDVVVLNDGTEERAMRRATRSKR